MTDLNNYRWVRASARMGITDVMWQYSLEISGNADTIPLYEMLEYRHPTTHYPLIRCIPVSRDITTDTPSQNTVLEGYSRAIYLQNPIPLWERQSKITLDSAGEITAYENPITYLNRIWAYTDYGLVSAFQVIPDADVLKKQFTYDAHPVNDLLNEIATDYKRVFFEKIVLVNSIPVHRFYLVDFDDIDTQLDLPAALTITAGDSAVIGQPGPKYKLDLTDSKNMVWVELCRKKDNAWFFAERKLQAVINKTELPRILVYRSSNLLPDPAGKAFPTETNPATANYGCITVIPGYESQSGGISYGTAAENAACQTITNAKADELLAYLNMDVKQYDITLRLTETKYYQLALYQKVTINGFSGVPNGELMRITNLDYTFTPISDGGDTVTMTLVPDTELQVARRFEEMQDEIRSNYTALKQSLERSSLNNKMGVVKTLTTDRTYANIQTRSSGRIVQVRAWGERIVS